MRVEKRVEVPVYDLSLIRNMWEGRVKKYKQRQRKEKERIENSALSKVNQQWEYRIACKALKPSELDLLQHYLERTALGDIQPYQENTDESQIDEDKFIFELDGDKWTELPAHLRAMIYLREWHIRNTRIHKLPDYIVRFQDLSVLDIPKNGLEHLPTGIGKLTGLRELNVNYNRLTTVPAELGACENLERLELTGNLNLQELPFELSSLKKLKHLDIAENKFGSIPICALRMSSLQILDMSNNLLTNLPDDMDRLAELTTLFIHKNKMTYLPLCLNNIKTLKMIVVGAKELKCYPSALAEDPTIKFIKLYDNTVDSRGTRRGEKGEEEEADTTRQGENDKEFLQTYMDSLKDREVVPCYTTKVSFSCLL